MPFTETIDEYISYTYTVFVIIRKRHLRNGAPHKVFGSLLATLRQKAGIPYQSQLAKLVKFYGDFSQTTDEEVRELLASAAGGDAGP